ncbi:hypothetical protein [Rhodohalobacter sp. 614A]|nr:hypothetical protein [Rhodohalobacter sp. 614A]
MNSLTTFSAIFPAWNTIRHSSFLVIILCLLMSAGAAGDQS